MKVFRDRFDLAGLLEKLLLEKSNQKLLPPKPDPIRAIYLMTWSSDLIPESFDSELMDRIMMRVYNAIANTVNDFPGLKEDGDNIRMTYYY